VSKYYKITSVSGGVNWLAEVNKRIMSVRLDQAVARDKKEWFRLEEQLKELYKERREVQGQMQSLEVRNKPKRDKFGAIFQ